MINLSFMSTAEMVIRNFMAFNKDAIEDLKGSEKKIQLSNRVTVSFKRSLPLIT